MPTEEGHSVGDHDCGAALAAVACAEPETGAAKGQQERQATARTARTTVGNRRGA